MKFDGNYVESVAPEMMTGPWTIFWDMHSGGSQNTPYDYIFIQANKAEARAVFGARFSLNADSVNCSCCGGNYSVSEYDNITDATGFHRNLASDKNHYIEGKGEDYTKWGGRVMTPAPLIVFMNSTDTCFIFANEIANHERDESNIPDASYAYDSYDDDYSEGEDDNE